MSFKTVHGSALWDKVRQCNYLGNLTDFQDVSFGLI
jgi:hypothetical protein